MHDYGDKKYGLTGDSHGWRLDYVKLTLRRPDHQAAAPARDRRGFLERGWFTDDFSVTGGGATSGATTPRPTATGFAEVDSFTTPPAPAGIVTRARRPAPTTTSPSGGTSTASTRGCSTRTTRPTSTTRGRSRRSSTTLQACSSGTATRRTATTTTSRQPATAEHRLEGWSAPRRQPLRPVPAAGRGGRQGSSTLNNLPSRPQSSNAAFGLSRRTRSASASSCSRPSRSASTARTSRPPPGQQVH